MLKENTPKIIPQILQNRIYKPTRGRAVYVSEKSEIEVEIQLRVINKFGSVVIIW